jgi:hypothetical protein
MLGAAAAAASPACAARMMASVKSWGMTSATSTRSFSTSALRSLRSRGLRSRSSNGRVSGSGGSGFSHGGASTVLLDKFVKHTCMDGSLIVRSPFSVKVRSSKILQILWYTTQTNIEFYRFFCFFTWIMYHPFQLAFPGSRIFL